MAEKNRPIAYLSGTTSNISTSRFEHNLFTSKLRYCCSSIQDLAKETVDDLIATRQIDNLIIAQILPEAFEFTNASATILPTLNIYVLIRVRRATQSYFVGLEKGTENSFSSVSE